jgi:hypothetical protein
VILNSQVTLGTVAQVIVGPSINPQLVFLHSQETATSRYIYFGGPTISATTGPHLDSKESVYITLHRGETLYAVGDPAGVVVGIMVQNQDG